MDEHGLAESDNALLDTGDGTLEHKEVVVDLSVADETTHGGDGLLGDIELGRGVASIVTAARADASVTGTLTRDGSALPW